MAEMSTAILQLLQPSSLLTRGNFLPVNTLIEFSLQQEKAHTDGREDSAKFVHKCTESLRFRDGNPAHQHHGLRPSVAPQDVKERRLNTSSHARSIHYFNRVQQAYQ
jgi:hypothetical protein